MVADVEEVSWVTVKDGSGAVPLGPSVVGLVGTLGRSLTFFGVHSFTILVWLSASGAALMLLPSDCFGGCVLSAFFEAFCG